MSRVGYAPVSLPSGVDLKVADGQFQVKGPKGQLARPVPAGISVDVSDGTATLGRSDDKKTSKSLHGLARALLANMVTGVTDGFSRVLEIQGVGYRADTSRLRRFRMDIDQPLAVEVEIEQRTANLFLEVDRIEEATTDASVPKANLVETRVVGQPFDLLR